eukprot:Skav205570  [mRNA]  locus=scaffold1407:80362:88295:- [translate_table: standard]
MGGVADRTSAIAVDWWIGVPLQREEAQAAQLPAGVDDDDVAGMQRWLGSPWELKLVISGDQTPVDGGWFLGVQGHVIQRTVQMAEECPDCKLRKRWALGGDRSKGRAIRGQSSEKSSAAVDGPTKPMLSQHG